jgi:hypothetical protein
MFIILSYKGNASKNNIKIPSSTIRTTIRKQTRNASKDAGGKRDSQIYTVGGNVN